MSGAASIVGMVMAAIGITLSVAGHNSAAAAWATVALLDGLALFLAARVMGHDERRIALYRQIIATRDADRPTS